ncbi:MAG: c-type cytochrome [Terriglobales bacterium]|jgi:mono/diheme cytochrome c family protein
MRNPALALILFVLVSFFSAAQETKPAPKTAISPVPVKAARELNPVKPTPESIAEGKKIYTYDCATCHGISGDGKTDIAKDLKIPDLTDPTLQKDRTDGELFYILKNGHGDMPPEGDRAKPERIWDLVNYVRYLARKQPPADQKPSN